ncbi:hypothetical protein CY34DRAFT_140843 [Suillus luteus UH-Slu-Lm8-n1]|uniref:Uncharacterized protein n=1 Tax=Suillus luteus UH-Slu-Lm8-n1 TaxID=930992 RepID=A0A0D0AEC8_9AGAM|nr:hypothetical protein CY34DRAFT_140843 [Suillus luteus UH-Slu-Lm8-n1]
MDPWRITIRRCFRSAYYGVSGASEANCRYSISGREGYIRRSYTGFSLECLSCGTVSAWSVHDNCKLFQRPCRHPA